MRVWFLLLPLSTSLFGCGPEKRPEEPCDGPSFNLVVTAEGGPLPADTRINIRYGSNQKGEAYRLGQQTASQAVFCDEDTTLPSGSGGDSGREEGVQALRCRLYTQGPASLDATASGYQSLEYEKLSLDKDRYCNVAVNFELRRELPDAGK